jgi:hypothetical protein
MLANFYPSSSAMFPIDTDTPAKPLAENLGSTDIGAIAWLIETSVSTEYTPRTLHRTITVVTSPLPVQPEQEIDWLIVFCPRVHGDKRKE